MSYPPKHYNCRCELVPVFTVDKLVDLANELTRIRRQKTVVQMRDMSDMQISRIKLAIAFDKLSPAKKLQAMLEEWDMSRIVQELY